MAVKVLQAKQQVQGKELQAFLTEVAVYGVLLCTCTEQAALSR